MGTVLPSNVSDRFGASAKVVAAILVGVDSDPVDWLSAVEVLAPLENLLPTTPWNYAAATGGIDNSNTAVAIKAAVPSLRNYVCSMQIAHATLGASTEFSIRDGAGGTVLWRTLLHTTAMPLQTIVFDPPLRGTANTLLEMITHTAVTGDVLASFQGFVAA